MEEKRVIELLVDDISWMDGVMGMAVTETPAIEMGFMKFAKTENPKYFAFVDEEKHVITGPAMIPFQEIKRYDEFGDEYYVFFSDTTIRTIAEKYFEQGYQTWTNIEHEDEVCGNVVFESWFSTGEICKSSAIGYKNLPVGTWMISMKINNLKMWNKIKNMGEGAGFSIEGYFQEKVVKNSEAKIEKMKQILKSTELNDVEKIDEIKKLYKKLNK